MAAALSCSIHSRLRKRMAGMVLAAPAVAAVKQLIQQVTEEIMLFS